MNEISECNTSFSIERIHVKVNVNGIVQGVGFRPFVFSIAMMTGINGHVYNTTDGVIIHAEGSRISVQDFLNRIVSSKPPLAHIDSITTQEEPLYGFSEFCISSSDSSQPKRTLISPDAAICSECLNDITNPQDRRYGYAFTNCTNCGPRFTIIDDIPYDRTNTSMKNFQMCPECLLEYSDPRNRRFHAQPNACPVCGPQAEFFLKGSERQLGNWVSGFQNAILNGAIIAVKGIGGFQLACMATNHDAVIRLRQKKHRPWKPFAVMCRDLDSARQYVSISSAEQNLLTSPQAPIVLLDKKSSSDSLDALAPNINTLGVMLPYSPLHVLMFSEKIDMMVMTSGNLYGQPLIHTNEEAVTLLSEIADGLLLHNRPIVNRCDDSVVKVFDQHPYFFRRARGYAPQPVVMPLSSPIPILALGSDLKNTYTFLKGNNAFVGPHIGDLENEETINHFMESFRDMQKFLDVTPGIIAHDLHPSFMSTRIASQLSDPSRRFPVQHHHAHFASCLAENKISSPAWGIILDGTGYGADGHIWGFEILHGDYASFDRVAHLKYLRLPGGDAGTRNPWRMAISYLSLLREPDKNFESEAFHPERSQRKIIEHMITNGIQSPLTSSCGRFFDAVAALLGICPEVTYEGQAAIELMEYADKELPYSPYPYTRVEETLDPTPVIAGIIADICSGYAKGHISARFHHTIVAMSVETIMSHSTQYPSRQVVLSGGVFQNTFLLRIMKEQLALMGYEAILHQIVPPNDGGISLGQAAIATRLYTGHSHS